MRDMKCTGVGAVKVVVIKTMKILLVSFLSIFVARVLEISRSGKP